MSYRTTYGISREPLTSLELKESTQPTTQKETFDTLQNCDKPSVKHSLEKPILLNIMNLPRYLAQDSRCFLQPSQKTSMPR